MIAYHTVGNELCTLHVWYHFILAGKGYSIFYNKEPEKLCRLRNTVGTQPAKCQWKDSQTQHVIW